MLLLLVLPSAMLQRVLFYAMLLLSKQLRLSTTYHPALPLA
jgi:hypothetical protein